MSIWGKLAEAVGIETEANWDRAAKQRNMQRYGTTDRRDQLGPMAHFNMSGTGLAQRQATAAATPARMIPRPGGMQIPIGTDRPGQGNPLTTPTRPGMAMSSASPLGTAPNSPQSKGQDWLSILTGGNENDSDEG